VCEIAAIFANHYEAQCSFRILDVEIYPDVQSAIVSSDKEESAKYLRKVAFIVRKFQESAKRLYKLMIVPEIDIHKMKDLVEQSIKEFRKQVGRCDLAFEQLLKSLNIFIERFDKYYEKFMSEGKNPMVFFLCFVEDVKQQYSKTDKQGCRDILN
jgi:hypothetical protein